MLSLVFAVCNTAVKEVTQKRHGNNDHVLLVFTLHSSYPVNQQYFSVLRGSWTFKGVLFLRVNGSYVGHH